MHFMLSLTHIRRLVVLECLYFDLWQAMVNLQMFCKFIGQIASSLMGLARHVLALMVPDVQLLGYDSLLRRMCHVLSNHACAFSLL